MSSMIEEQPQQEENQSQTLALTEVDNGYNEPRLGGGNNDIPSNTKLDRHSYVPVNKLTSPQIKPTLHPVATHQLNWESTLARVADSIISIRANHVRSFDTETSGAYSATGFIVDAERGLVLTNRHVVSPAPIVAMGILSNYEEVTLKPIYRDPVHDFGFFQFDPSQVQFMKLNSVPLSPERAKVGLDIRVVGNNAGEKLSILAGTLARLDRKAPNYGRGEYNDFNTFYLQAASGTSGGSSGSPVLDIEGHAIALNAGGSNRASSSYYLPLDRVLYALKLLQVNQPVPRGTLQVEFEHLAYDELRRLGLPSDLERQVRFSFPYGTGLLAVNHVLPKGPAHDILKSGDMILRINHLPVNSFIKVFEILDHQVDQEIEVEVCRGDQVLNLQCTVQDLHSITPNRFVEIGGGIVNELSYQLARSYGQPVGGVYVASSGYMLDSASCGRRSIIVSINHIPTETLDDFIRACQILPDNARVPIRFYNLEKPFSQKVKLMRVDRHWHPFREAVRDDCTGQWTFHDFPPALTRQSITSTAATLPHVARLPGSQVNKSIVTVDFHIPYLIDGMKSTQFYGAGVVVDAEAGLVVCDRDTVPVFIGDLNITFAGAIVIPGKILFIHPIYNFSVIQYDPKLIAGTPVESITLLDEELKADDEVYFSGVSANLTLTVKKTNVAGLYPIPARPSLPPRWRATNVTGIKLDSIFSSQGGVLCNELGHAYALWVNYSYQDDSGSETSVMQGLPVRLIKPILTSLQNKLTPTVRSLEVELAPTRFSSVCNLGLNHDRLIQFQSHPEFQHSLLNVVGHLSTTSPAAFLLEVGDVILEAQDQLILTFSDLDRLVEESTDGIIHLTILRAGDELAISIPTVTLACSEAQRIICWAGAILQDPHRAVLEQTSSHLPLPQGPYLSCTLTGSPVDTFHLPPGVWITHLNDTPVPTLTDFLHHARHLTTDYVRLTTVTRTHLTKVTSLKLDPTYWPLWELSQDDSRWRFAYP